MQISVIIADDHPLIRSGVRSILSGDNGITVIAEASNGVHLLELLHTHQPHVILLDIIMPRMGGVEAGKIIKAKYPAVQLIAFSMSDDDTFVREMWHLGAKGYLLKDVEQQELISAIQTVHAGGSYFCKTILDTIARLLGKEQKLFAKQEKTLQFNSTETQIIRLICKGYTCKEIGVALRLAEKTVEHYKEKIRSKTGAKNSTEIAVHAVLHQLVRKEDLHKTD